MSEQGNGVRILVVNADDFGASDGVNEGIITAYERGIVTSASLMVRGAAADAAADYAWDSRLSVGLHFDLGEWAWADGDWRALYELVDLSDPAAVQDELDRQLAAFTDLVGRPPTHLDSHQHVHREEPVHSALAGAGWRMHIPVRNATPGGIVYDGGFYGQEDKGVANAEAITVDALVALIEGLAPGVTEVGCHPAARDDLDTMYRRERITELATLCDPRLREVIERTGVLLCGFADLALFIT